MSRTTASPSEPKLNLHGFFATHPFFRVAEFTRAFVAAGHTEGGAHSALSHYQRSGVIIRVHKGVYGVYAELELFDPVMLASKLHPSAVVAYDGAAMFHGLAELEHQCCYLAPYPLRRVHFDEVIYRCVADPQIGDPCHRLDTLVRQELRSGQPIFVTSFERTLVDCLERIDLGPDVTMLFARFLEMPEPPLDLSKLVKAISLFSRPIGRARLGLLLSAHPKYADEAPLLDWLARNIHRESTYATRERGPGGRYIARWRLMVPTSMFTYVRRL